MIESQGQETVERLLRERADRDLRELLEDLSQKNKIQCSNQTIYSRSDRQTHRQTLWLLELLMEPKMTLAVIHLCPSEASSDMFPRSSRTRSTCWTGWWRPAPPTRSQCSAWWPASHSSWWHSPPGRTDKSLGELNCVRLWSNSWDRILV